MTETTTTMAPAALPLPLAPMPEKIALAVNEAMKACGYVQKKGRNKDHAYNFAAIGDILKEVQPALADAGLIVLQVEGQPLMMFENRLLKITYQFYLQHTSGVIWSSPVPKTGIARILTNNGGIDDKAFNKCGSAARKYFLMELFQIPTGDLADADADAHDERPAKHIDTDRGEPQQDNGPPTDAKPNGADRLAKLRKDGELWAADAEAEMREAGSEDELTKFFARYGDTLDKLQKVHPDRYAQFQDALAAHRTAKGWA